jgi:hypothetical protein
MPENETGTSPDAPEQGSGGGGDVVEQPPQAPTEDITYHAVEKDGQVTAIWEMQGRKHLRTIDPRSRLGQEILRLYTSEHHEEAGPTGEATGAAS